MYQTATALLPNANAILVGTVMAMLAICIAAIVFSNRLTAIWMKMAILPNRKGVLYGLALAGLLAPLYDPVSDFLLRILGLVVIAAIVSIVAAAAFGERSVKSYTERGAPGEGGMNWGFGIVVFLIIVAVAGGIIAASQGVFGSWPVKFGENIVKSVCGDLCKQ